MFPKSFRISSAAVVCSLLVALLFVLAHPVLAGNPLVGRWQQVSDPDGTGGPQYRGYIILNSDGTGVIAASGVDASPIESQLTWGVRGKTLWMKYVTLRPLTTTNEKFEFQLDRVGHHIELRITKLPDPDPSTNQAEIDFYKVKGN